MDLYPYWNVLLTFVSALASLFIKISKFVKVGLSLWSSVCWEIFCLSFSEPFRYLLHCKVSGEDCYWYSLISRHEIMWWLHLLIISLKHVFLQANQSLFAQCWLALTWPTSAQGWLSGVLRRTPLRQTPTSWWGMVVSGLPQTLSFKGTNLHYSSLRSLQHQRGHTTARRLQEEPQESATASSWV